MTSRVGLLVACVVAVCGCALGGFGPDPDNAALHAQAQAALQRWSDAVAQAGGPGAFSPVGEQTGQIGDWEEAVGGNNKSALMSGVIEASTPMDGSIPPDAEITWADGTSETAHLMSAADAVTAIKRDAVQPCPECSPLTITGARLTTGPVETTRGTAIAPVWEFTIAGTAVLVTRVAVQSTVRVEPPPWDPNHAPVGISIESATIEADDTTLMAAFTGAPDNASKSCGEDYSAEAVESDAAVVVIVHRHPNSMIAACSAVGARRFASVTLAAPLAGRAVLEVQEGLPVPVTRR